MPLEEVDIMSVSTSHALGTVGGMCVGTTEVRFSPNMRMCNGMWHAMMALLAHLFKLNAHNKGGGPPAAVGRGLLLLRLRPALHLLRRRRGPRGT